MSLQHELEELESAEDFLDYFAIAYDPAVVQVNRLHILQRFHDYLAKTVQPDRPDVEYELYRQLLERAYQDFVASDALTEKVFKVFHPPQAAESGGCRSGCSCASTTSAP